MRLACGMDAWEAPWPHAPGRARAAPADLAVCPPLATACTRSLQVLSTLSKSAQGAPDRCRLPCPAVPAACTPSEARRTVRRTLVKLLKCLCLHCYGFRLPQPAVRSTLHCTASLLDDLAPCSPRVPSLRTVPHSLNPR